MGDQTHQFRRRGGGRIADHVQAARERPDPPISSFHPRESERDPMSPRTLLTLTSFLALTALSLAPVRKARAQDPCTQIDPPPPPECFGLPSVDPHGGTAGPYTPNTSGHNV